MNEFKFICSHCKQRIATRIQHAGELILCPSCDKEIVIPHPSEAPKGELPVAHPPGWEPPPARLKPATSPIPPPPAPDSARPLGASEFPPKPSPEPEPTTAEKSPAPKPPAPVPPEEGAPAAPPEPPSKPPSVEKAPSTAEKTFQALEPSSPAGIPEEALSPEIPKPPKPQPPKAPSPKAPHKTGISPELLSADKKTADRPGPHVGVWLLLGNAAMALLVGVAVFVFLPHGKRQPARPAGGSDLDSLIQEEGALTPPSPSGFYSLEELAAAAGELRSFWETLTNKDAAALASRLAAPLPRDQIVDLIRKAEALGLASTNAAFGVGAPEPSSAGARAPFTATAGGRSFRGEATLVRRQDAWVVARFQMAPSGTNAPVLFLETPPAQPAKTNAAPAAPSLTNTPSPPAAGSDNSAAP